MSESKHTPGPWELDDDGIIPDLLAALRELLDSLPCCICEDAWKIRNLSDPDCVACEMRFQIEQARAAIAKATGKTGDRDNA